VSFSFSDWNTYTESGSGASGTIDWSSLEGELPLPAFEAVRQAWVERMEAMGYTSANPAVNALVYEEPPYGPDYYATGGSVSTNRFLALADEIETWVDAGLWVDHRDAPWHSTANRPRDSRWTYSSLLSAAGYGTDYADERFTARWIRQAKEMIDLLRYGYEVVWYSQATRTKSGATWAEVSDGWAATSWSSYGSWISGALLWGQPAAGYGTSSSPQATRARCRSRVATTSDSGDADANGSAAAIDFYCRAKSPGIYNPEYSWPDADEWYLYDTVSGTLRTTQATVILGDFSSLPPTGGASTEGWYAEQLEAVARFSGLTFVT